MHKKRVLFITSAKRRIRPYTDPSVRYRCYNVAKDLIKSGWYADICTLENFNYAFVDCYDIFIFHRPNSLRAITAITNLLEKLGKPYLADFDDLIFGRRYALQAPVYISGRAFSKRSIQENYEECSDALRCFEYITVSTTELRQRVLEYNPHAVVEAIHNGLDEDWARFADRFYGAERDPNLISYLPGTGSHDHDFKLIENVLLEHLNQFKNNKLLIVGPLNFNQTDFPRDRVIRINRVSYKVLPRIIKRTSLNLAPLADNEFNRCKSGLKFFESAVYGVPTIGSPIPDMLRFKTEGLYLANSENDWLNCLSSYFSNSSNHSVSTKVKKYALDACLSNRQTPKLEVLLNRLLSG